jgi:abortive infection bacteriophage resistance protein
MRASVTYHLGHEIGPFGHMDVSNFKQYLPPTPSIDARGLDFGEFSRRVVSHEKQSSEVFISHFRAKYSDPYLPVWMLTEIVSFGTLSRITENLRDKQIQTEGRPRLRSFPEPTHKLVEVPLVHQECLCSPWSALEPGALDQT